jgi:hypothetical protein
MHPDLSSHWIKTSIKFDGRKIDRVKVIFTHVDGQPPLDRNGVRSRTRSRSHFDLGYRVLSRADIPHEPPFFLDIGTSRDCFGSPVSFAPGKRTPKGSRPPVAQRTAGHQLRGREPVHGHRDQHSLVDHRPVLHRPLYPGPTMHLYWSNDDPEGTFTASTGRSCRPMRSARPSPIRTA